MPRQLSRSPPAWRRTPTLALLTILLAADPAVAEPPISLLAPGATLEEVLTIARRLSPELAARALDTEAAQARVAIAGSLADPTLRITSDEIDRTSGPRKTSTSPICVLTSATTRSLAVAVVAMTGTLGGSIFRMLTMRR